MCNGACIKSSAREREHPGAPQVLDLGQVVAGNFCGALLAYYGADVIKVIRDSPKADPNPHSKSDPDPDACPASAYRCRSEHRILRVFVIVILKVSLLWSEMTVCARHLPKHVL